VDEEADMQRLHSVTLNGSASCVGRTLASLDMEASGAEIASIRRGKGGVEVAPDTTLQAGDVVVLRGGAEAVTRAEQRLTR
jgi:CPA2 family monovalent cation:H+ antiporter-2